MCFLIVDAASPLTFSPSNKDKGRVGEPFVILCQTTDVGVPATVLQWYQNNNLVAFQTKGNPAKMTIASVVRESTGIYICKGDNGIGEVTKSLDFKATGEWC